MMVRHWTIWGAVVLAGFNSVAAHGESDARRTAAFLEPQFYASGDQVQSDTLRAGQ